MTMPRLRAPIVLVHGLFGFERLLRFDYFFRVRKALEEAGNRVLVPRLSPTGGVQQRAGQLAAFLDARLPGEPAHFLAHSMGGLDARWLASRLGRAAQVLTLTTLGTPHRGSPFADWSVGRLVRLATPVMRWLGLPVQGFHDLTTGSAARFNAEVPDVPGVRYFSVAGAWRFRWMNPQWHMSAHRVSAAEQGPNDGLVSVSSATWGESSEVWDSDHMGLVGWPEPGLTRQRNDRLPQYAALLGRLREAGF